MVTRRTPALLLLTILALASLCFAQDTIIDAAGNTVVVTVTEDADGTATTSTISTILPDTEPSPTVVGNPLPPVIATAERCTTEGCPAPPTTYASYYTVNGVQMTAWPTFVATTPVTPPPQTVPAGTILDASQFFASIQAVAATASIKSGALPAVGGSGVLPLVGIITACLLGAIVVL